ncbi:MAG: methionine synthase [bacterium]|nr:methionine synthase [bacterium]
MRDFRDRLLDYKPLVGDGAMGTMLFERGLKPGECPEKLNLTNPDILEDTAGRYLDAGAEIIQTNTFGGSPLKLAQYSLDDKTGEINRAAVKAVRIAVGGRAYVSGSVGPTGKLQKPYGDAEPEDIRATFERQIAALAGAGVDVICIETMTDINEAVLAVEAVKAAAPETPVMATMTFDATPKGFYTIMGVGIKQSVERLTEAGADVIGSNCGNGIETMVGIARDIVARTDLPVIIQSNAGLPEVVNGETVYNETPEFMAEKAKALLDIGVSVIGGCCGTTPEHIRALRYMVDDYGN